jgi:hypothetical protein
MKDKDQNIDNFIKENMDIQEPSEGFSNTVMEEIIALDLEKEKALFSLLQKHVLEEASINFTSGVMAGIEQKSKAFTYQPVIGKKVWFFIGSIIAIIFLYSFLKLDFTVVQHIYLENLQAQLNNLFAFEYPSLRISPLFGLGIFALSSFLYLDYFIRNRRLAH